MAVIQAPITATKTYHVQWNTQNKSFLDMQFLLEQRGIKNNAFFLALADPGLAHINPRDPNLNYNMKCRVMRECTLNYWYFLREILKIPEQGGAANSGKMYELHRGNLAMNFCLANNWNIFAELPRQHGKTIGVVCRMLWEFLFGTRNSEMSFINKKYEDSKLNLSRLKEIRRALPVYLQMSQDAVDPATGKKIKPKDSVDYLENPFNRNKIVTVTSANSKIKANTLGRGCTQPRQWYDEFAFIPYNQIVYLSATPAYNTASANARKNNAPYGIVITTTPGDLTTEEGRYAHRMTELATDFNEMWYDMPLHELNELIDKNENSSFIYIRYTYQQLGRSEEWFRKICVDMQKDWDAIRREVLLEWSDAASNSPFSKDDLSLVETLCLKEPLKQVKVCRNFTVNIYKEFSSIQELNRDTYIMGVDVSGGLKRDSSTFTIINARTTEVIADFNCNYINAHELAVVIAEFVTRYLPNTLINIERNGGFGQAVLADLKSTSLRSKLYYEMKERVIEETVNNGFTQKRKAMVRNFGFDNTGRSRELLMDILRERMAYHKDKFISPNICKELKTLIVSKSGRIDHTPNGHDDQIMSYLMAMYVWSEGKNIREQWGIEKGSIKTDQNAYEEVLSFNEGFQDITSEIEQQTLKPEVAKQTKWLKDGQGMTYSQWLNKRRQEEDKALQEYLQNPINRKAYAKEYNEDITTVERKAQLNGYKIPDNIFSSFNTPFDNNDEYDDY